MPTAEDFLADVEAAPSAEQFLSDAPNAEAFLTDAPGAIGGTVNEFKRGLLAGQQQLVAEQLNDAPKAPSMRQLRRAYVTAMSNGRYQDALTQAGDDPVKARRVENALGPTAQVSRITTAIDANRQILSEQFAELEQEQQAIPQSAAMAEWSKADNSNWFKTFAKNPVEITSGIIAQSIPAMTPALAGNMVAPGGRVGRALAAGVGSYGVESAHAFLDSARQTGYDFTDPAKVQEFFANPQAQAQAREYALKRGVPIGIFDALTAGVAGKFVGPLLREGAERTTGKVLTRTGAELATQMAGGMTGEAAAQVTTGDDLSVKDIVAEGIGELGSGPVEAYSNLREARRNSQRSTPTAQPSAARPTDDELPPLPDQPTSPIRLGPLQTAEEFLSPTLEEAQPPVVNETPREEQPPAAANSAPATAPEAPATIEAQMELLQAGKRDVVLITPGETMPAVPEGFQTYQKEGREDVGTFIYNPKRVRPGHIGLAISHDTLGNLLGYGISTKPKPGTEAGVVVVRDPNGVEKQAVVTDEKNLPNVTKAAEKIAAPGDTVQLETAENVIEQRRKGAATVTEAHLQQAREAVDNVTRGPVQFPDMADAIDASRERVAQALHQKPWKRLSSAQRKAIDKGLRATTGEGFKADEAQQGLGEKYAGLRPDDFANAILDAGEARLLEKRKADSPEVQQVAQEIAEAEAQAKAESEKQTDETENDPWADKIDELLSKAIEATNLNRAQTLEGVLGAPVWFTKSFVNGLLRIIRATYRGTKNLAQAIQAGVEWARTQNLKDFSETELRAWLESTITVTPEDDDINAREFGDQLAADQALPPDPARMVGNLLYDRRTNESDAGFAARVMAAVGGPQQAIEVFSDATNGLPGSVRMFLGQLIIKALGHAGQHEAAARFYDETFAAHVTETAQALQTLSAFLSLTTEGKIIWARRKIERAARDLVAPFQPQLDEARKQIEEANRAGIEETTAAPDVQAAAREAVDAAIEKAAATPGSELALAIRQEVLDGLVKAGLLTAREAEIAALHYEGTADTSTLAEKLQKAGVPLHDERAKAINDLYKAKTKAEREKVRSRARRLRREQTAREAGAGNEDAIDKAIRLAMRDARLKFSQIIREHHTKVDATGKSLAEKIAAASGLPEAEASKLAKAVEERFAALVTKRKRAALDKLLKPVKRIARPQLIERLIALSNLGALSEEQFWNAVRSKLDLPQWSQELADRIRALVDIIERIPQDQTERKQKAQTDLLNTIERAKGMDALDLGIAFYVTNILTGFTTHAKNLLSTMLNATSTLGTEAARAVATGRLDDLPLMLEAIGKGVKRGTLAAGDVLRTGMVTGSRLGKVEAGRALELSRFGERGGVPVRNRATRAVMESRLAKILNLWKYNFRLMAAEDLLFFKPAEEVKAALLAKRLARAEGLRGSAAQDRARQILGYGQQAVAAARAQAAQEGLTGSAANRRVAEILNNNRPVELREDARQFALRTTFNNDPYGALGAVAHLLNQAKASPNAKLRLGANLITPFTNIIANVVNESLNYTPVGVVRARWNGNELLGHERAKLTPQQQADLKAELYAKALVGTTLLTGLALKAAGDLDDEDPDFAIYGQGPASPADRQGLQAKGWIGHSIKVGDRYFSYANTPVAIPMAWLGGIFDRLRDARVFQNRSAQRTAESLPLMAASSAVGMGKVITEQSFMVGLMDMANMVSEPSPEASGRAAFKQATRMASSAVIPNAVRQVDKYFDPTQYEQRTAEGILVNAIPFVRGAAGQPTLNALGLPVQTPLAKQFTSSQAAADPLIKMLAETGNWPTLPDRNEIYPIRGRTMTDAEYYDFVKGSGEILRREVAALVKERGWSTLKPEDRAKMISETVSLSRQEWRADHGW